MAGLEETLKSEFFRKPTVREIKEDKHQVPISLGLVNTIEKLLANEYIIIDYEKLPIIPYYDEQGNRQYEDWQNFLKRGPQVNMDRYFSREQAIAEQRPFYIQREEYFNLNSAEYTKGKLEENIAYSRYGWWGIREEAHKAVHLVDCIEAGRLFAYSEKSKNVRNKIEIREYNLGDIINHGGKFMVKVPSRTRNRRYGVTLESVPVGNNDTQYANVYDLRFKHSCEMLEAGFSYRYRPREDVFCPHVMAAYAKIVQSTWGDKLKKTAKLNPFAVPSQMTVNFYHNMDNNVLVKIPRRPVRRLNKAEKEILLWDFVKKYGNPRTGPNKTFYASGRKLQEYNW